MSFKFHFKTKCIMKKTLMLIAGAITCGIIILSCLKTSEDNERKEMQITFSAQKKINGTASRGCNCDGHGGAVLASISWDLATCKSNCSKGIGFRCGKRGGVLCADGFACIYVAGENCPDRFITADVQQMTANYTFYSEGESHYLKLSFQEAINPETLEENNNIFEIESSDLINLHPDIQLSGNSYQGYQPEVGNYNINLEDGEFGSVTFPIILIP